MHDVHSQFRCVSYQLFKNMDKALTLRSEAAEWLRTRGSHVLPRSHFELQKFIPGGFTWDFYVKQIASGEIHGDLLTLYALSELLCFQAYLISSAETERFITTVHPSTCQPQTTIFLAVENDIFYDSLQLQKHHGQPKEIGSPLLAHNPLEANILQERGLSSASQNQNTSASSIQLRSSDGYTDQSDDQMSSEKKQDPVVNQPQLELTPTGGYTDQHSPSRARRGSLSLLSPEQPASPPRSRTGSFTESLSPVKSRRITPQLSSSLPQLSPEQNLRVPLSTSQASIETGSAFHSSPTAYKSGVFYAEPPKQSSVSFQNSINPPPTTKKTTGLRVSKFGSPRTK